MKGVLGSENLFSKSYLERPRVTPLSGYIWPFCGSLATISDFTDSSMFLLKESSEVDFAGGMALQVVSWCPGAKRLVLYSGKY